VIYGDALTTARRVYIEAKRSVNKLGNGTSMTPGTPQNASMTKYTDMHGKNFEHRWKF